jgi:hypothetical protein
MDMREKPFGVALASVGIFVLATDVPQFEECRRGDMCAPVVDLPPHNHEEPKPGEMVPVIKLAISSSAGGWNGGPLFIDRPRAAPQKA